MRKKCMALAYCVSVAQPHSSDISRFSCKDYVSPWLLPECDSFVLKLRILRELH